MCNLKHGKEGILFAAKDDTCISCELVFESENKNIVTAEIAYPADTLRVIAVHGPQESEVQETKTEFYVDLEAEVERCMTNGTKLIITGDLNAKLEQDGPTGANGKLLFDIVKKYNLVVLNFHSETTGKWTRIQKKGMTEVMSVLDYVIVDQATSDRFVSMFIDDSKLYTPYRIKLQRQVKTIVFTDHCALISFFDILKGAHTRKQQVEKRSFWKISKEGLMRYHEVSSYDIGLGNVTQLTKPYDAWRAKVENIMSTCFQKITIKSNHPRKKEQYNKECKIRKTLSKVATKGKIQRNIARQYLARLIDLESKIMCDRKFKCIAKTVALLTENDSLSQSAFWKLKKSMSSSHQLYPRSVKTEDGQVTREPDEIKEEVKKEFKCRLRNREAHPGWETYVETTNEIVQLLMEQDCEQSPPFSSEELNQAVKKIKSGKSPGSDGIVGEILSKAGKGVLSPLLQIFNIIKEKREIPDTWNEVLITLIYKNKGIHTELINYRGIFLTVAVSKVFERLLHNRMQPSISRISLFQSGSRVGRSVADNLFLLRCTIDHARYMKKCVYLTTYDFQQAFDSLWLQDCLVSLKRIGVQNYLLQLINQLNKRALVRVKTPFGLTSVLTVDDIVKQGGVLGPVLCSASTAEHCGQNKGIAIGTAIIASLAHVDDMADVSDSCDDAETAHENAILFSQKKKLYHSVKKCFSMVIFQTRKDPSPSLSIGSNKVNIVTLLTYLGDVFNAQGNNQDLMKDRVQRGTKAFIGVEAFMRGASFGIHTVSVYLLLYRIVFISSILFSSEVWSNVTERDLKQLRLLQLRILRKMVGARKMTSSSFLFLELGVLPIKYELHIRQMTFLFHVIHLDECDPVKQVWRNLCQFPEYPNWWCDVKALMKKYSIALNEEQIKQMTKETYKKTIKKAVYEVAHNDLNLECSAKSKTKEIVFNKFIIQHYIQVMPPNLSKLIFQARSKTLDLKCHTPFLYSDTNCRWCGVGEETIAHIVNCGASTLPISDIQEEISAGSNLVALELIAHRIQNFLDLVNDL